MRHLAQLLQRGGTDLALGYVDDAQERRVVGRVGQQAQVAEDVLHFRAVEERECTTQVVGNACEPQGFFNRARLEIAAVEDAEIIPAATLVLVALMQARGDGGDFLRLVVVILALDDADGRPLDVVAPELLLMHVRIVCDELVRRAQDALRTAVVLLELDDLQLREVATQLVDVLGVRATPRVDALVVVAHAGEPRLRAGDGLEQAVLRVVGVLVFVPSR